MDEQIRGRAKAATKLRNKAYAINGLAEILKNSNKFDDWGYVLSEICEGMIDLIKDLEGDEE